MISLQVHKYSTYQGDDIYSAKLLIAFGANVNALNSEGKTPTDLAMSANTRYYFRNFKKQSSLKSWTGITMDEGDGDYGFMLISLPEADATGVIEKYERPRVSPSAARKVPAREVDPSSRGFDSSMDSVFHNTDSSPPQSLSQSTEERHQSLEEVESEMTQLLKPVGGKINEEVKLELTSRSALMNTLCGDQFCTKYEEGTNTRRLHKELDDELKQRNNETRSISDIDDILCSSKQHRELVKYRKTGSRILCLDGGGMKGLAEIDVMENLERITGKKITELFDWIVGTSTGGILALGLVYGEWYIVYDFVCANNYCELVGYICIRWFILLL